MNRPVQRSARTAALTVLRQYNTHRGDAADLLHSLLDTTDRSAQTTDLVYGVIRNTVLIDTLLTRLSGIDKRCVKPALWTILRIGVYELVYAPRTADYAILNEAVNMAYGVSSKKAAGFVNAVLRSIQRQIISRDGDSAAAPITHRIPRVDGTACIFSCAVLPEASGNPADFLHIAWSLPRWLVSDWINVYGTENAMSLCRASNRHPSVYAWPDTRRITAGGLAERLTAEGVQCRLWPERGAVRIRYGGSLAALSAFQDGLFYIQDPAAESIAAFLDPKLGAVLYDVCAAPGGKTLALALHINDSGRIIASDMNAVRLGRLDESIKRLKLTCIQTVCAADLKMYVGTTDRLDVVILDVPCSNTGVLARRVEARRRLEARPADSLLRLQHSLLNDAKGLLKPGSKLLYSTCSIQREENEYQIRNFLRCNPEFYLKKQQITLPSAENEDLFDNDGGYMALLEKR
jgi:16S rRNA (cytosine967-C5)-methyltransferase